MQDLPHVAAGECKNPYDLFFASDLRKRQCLLCLFDDKPSEEPLQVLSYHVAMLRHGKPLERLCHRPWEGEAKARWRYDTQEEIGRLLGLTLRQVQRSTGDLKKRGILLDGGLHYPRHEEQRGRQSFYRLSDEAQRALALLTVPYAYLFKGEPAPDAGPAYGAAPPASKVWEAWNEAWAPTVPDVPSLRTAMKDWRTASGDDLGAAIEEAFAAAITRLWPGQNGDD